MSAGAGPRGRRGRANRIGVYGLAVAALLAGAFALRLVGIDDPTIEQRETQSALLARRWSIDRADLPAWKERVLEALDEEVKPIEPPVLDALAAAEARLTGTESLWFPRLLSSLAWVAGGVFVLLIGRRITSRAGALVATALYLAWPYAVWHSRLFMPDALLVSALLGAIWTIIRYWDAPTTRRFAAAAGTSCVATLLKPGVAFLLVVAAFGAIALSRRELRRTVLGGRLPLFAAIASAGAVAYAVWGVYLTDFIWERAGDRRVTPELLVDADFWRGWWTVVDFLLRTPQPQSIIAIGAIVAGLLGLVVATPGLPRAVLGGLAVGYLAFGLAFANYTSTHPYYSLPLIPLLSLAIGVLVGWILERPVRLAPAVRAVVAAAVALTVGLAAQKGHALLTAPTPDDAIADYERIGEVTNHTTRAIVVDRELATPAMYWGWIVARAWEIDYSDRPPEWIEAETADYLVVTDLAALETHRGLRELAAGLPMVARGKRFVVFDLAATRAES